MPGAHDRSWDSDETTGPPPEGAEEATFAPPPHGTAPPANARRTPSGAAGRPTQIGGCAIERELARGGMGVVYVAVDVQTGRRVALKQTLGEGAEGQAAQRFAIEAQALGQLKHPNIVKVHRVGVSPHGPYLVMDLVEGESLKGRMQRGPIPVREAAVWGKALARALSHAHGRGILHRDLKPANVLLNTEGRPLLTDFGLAQDMSTERERLTRTGQMLGTPQYMAPEQGDGDLQAIGPRTDVYGLGATLYALLAGQPPFEGDNALNVIYQVLGKPPTPVRSHRPECDIDLQTIVLKCLEKRPDDRYASADALGDDLARFLAGEPIEGQPPQRLKRWLSRHWVATAFGFLTVVALVCGGLLAVRWLAQERGAQRLARLETSVDALESAIRLAEVSESDPLTPLSSAIDLGRAALDEGEGEAHAPVRDRIEALSVRARALLDREHRALERLEAVRRAHETKQRAAAAEWLNEFGGHRLQGSLLREIEGKSVRSLNHPTDLKASYVDADAGTFLLSSFLRGGRGGEVVWRRFGAGAPLGQWTARRKKVMSILSPLARSASGEWWVFHVDGQVVRMSSAGDVVSWPLKTPKPSESYVSCSVSGDGVLAAFTCGKYPIRLIDLTDGTLTQLRGRLNGASRLLFSPDGGALWVGLLKRVKGLPSGERFETGFLGVYDLPARRWRQGLQLQLAGTAQSMAVDPTGRLLAIGSMGDRERVGLIDTTTWTELKYDGARLLSEEDSFLSEHDPQRKFVAQYSALGFSPDGSKLYGALRPSGGFASILTVWDLATGAVVHRAEFTLRISSLSVSCDGTRLLLGGAVRSRSGKHSGRLEEWVIPERAR